MKIIERLELFFKALGWNCKKDPESGNIIFIPPKYLKLGNFELYFLNSSRKNDISRNLENALEAIAQIYESDFQSVWIYYNRFLEFPDLDIKEELKNKKNPFLHYFEGTTEEKYRVHLLIAFEDPNNPKKDKIRLEYFTLLKNTFDEDTIFVDGLQMNYDKNIFKVFNKDPFKYLISDSKTQAMNSLRAKSLKHNINSDLDSFDYPYTLKLNEYTRDNLLNILILNRRYKEFIERNSTLSVVINLLKKIDSITSPIITKEFS